MGVRGLTSYISENEDLFLEPFELHDTYLVIDGNCVLGRVYEDLTLHKNTCVFGGDSDEFYAEIKMFFLVLIRCNIKPIVVMDGSFESKKLKTILIRKKEKVQKLKHFNYGDLSIKILPLCIYQTFFNVLRDMQISFIVTLFEADNEIASIAKTLNCPVLSSDSDFFIFDVQYIPYHSLNKNITKLKLPNVKSKICLKCSVFTVDNFLAVNAIDKALLPIFVALMGNDYIDKSFLEPVIDHITIPKGNTPYSCRKLIGVMKWLKNESFDSAVNRIFLHVKKEYRGNVKKAISLTKTHYEMGIVSSYTYELLSNLLNDEKSRLSWLKIHKSNLKWPKEIDNLYKQGMIITNVLDLLFLNSFLTDVQVQDLSMKSPHFESLRLIGAINEILCEYHIGKPHHYRVFMVTREKYSWVWQNWNKDFKHICLNSLLNLSNDERLKIFYDFLGLDYYDIDIVSRFCGQWQTFVAACIYWLKSSCTSVSFRHIVAILLMAIANAIIQKKTGYYRSVSSFKNKYKEFLKEPNETPREEKPELSDVDFKTLLECISLRDCILVQNSLMPFRQFKEIKYFVSTIHMFIAFQCCVFYINAVNALLNLPVSFLKINDFYSGTLLINLYNDLEKGEKVVYKILNASPCTRKIYHMLCDALRDYTDNSTFEETSKKPRKRKNKAKNKLANENEEISSISPMEEGEQSSSDEFGDEENKYSCLLKL